jgi:prepilin-type N-terminal cleavage/methylation domain-containing protein
MKKLLRSQKGFTLIEILLVVAAIAILAGIVIVAINPAKQLGDTRNTQRRSDISALLSASTQYALDNNGVSPSGITTTPTEVCAFTGVTNCTGRVDLGVLTVNSKYITAIPRDPQTVAASGTQYYISKDVNGRITVTASTTEQGAVITLTR